MKALFALAGAVWFASAPIQAAGNERGCAFESIEASLELATEIAARSEASVGVSVAAQFGEQYRWAHAAGYADRELGVPLTQQHRMRIGSISKVLTAALVMRLSDREILDLDAPISVLVPEYEKHPGVTIARLASHTAGVRHYVESDRWTGAFQYRDHMVLRNAPRVVDGLDWFVRDNLLFRPGEREHYSSYAWTLISLAAERAANKPFLDLMEREVFDPLGLRDTTPDHPYALVAHRASSYEADRDGAIRRAVPTDRSFIWAGGGFLSTPSDLTRFAVTHLRAPFLSPRAQERMLERARISQGRGNYGIGWRHGLGYLERVPNTADLSARIERVKARLPDIVSHSGSAPGAHALLLYAPSIDLAMAYAANVNEAEEDSDVLSRWTDAFHRALLLAFLDYAESRTQRSPARRGLCGA